jgi:hypothetical protein
MATLNKTQIVAQLYAFVAKYAKTKSISDREPCWVCGGNHFTCKIIEVPVFSVQRDDVLKSAHAENDFILDVQCGHCGKNLGKFKSVDLDARVAHWRKEAEALPD